MFYLFVLFLYYQPPTPIKKIINKKLQLDIAEQENSVPLLVGGWGWGELQLKHVPHIIALIMQ